ncbi:ABC transporter permease [Labrys wisconsinensis]|uniref:Ribose transport system permease protein n=1 Tax=Labrys wisconsinensis TaxID=425677 RepID=A0ABU0JHV4_9HYPH|nr:ABC transporter permease [Labrys wisconsinensis]MDQ0473874.1 ribose transport system permease protein [Labrys wisconsinensis]
MTRSILTPARLRAAAPSLFLVLLVVLISLVTPGFARPDTLLVLLADTATLFILAAGLTFVILLGGIDLSVQTVASLATVLVALLVPQLGPAACLIALAAGLAAGLFSGLVHVVLKVPSFIATLATSGVVSGAALLVSKARTITIGEAGRADLGWVTGTLAGVPNVVLIGALVLVAGILVQRYTRFGRYSTAIGAGEPAAWASGIRVGRHKVMAFALCGLFAALAGVLLAGRLASGSPVLANQLLLPAIAAVIVGGTAITGGVGGIGRTAIGALIISVVRIGMTFLGVNIFAQQIVFGAVLVAAVAVTIDRSKIPIVK